MPKGYDHGDAALSLIAGQKVQESGKISLYELKACALLTTRDERKQNDESGISRESGSSCQFSSLKSRARIEGNP